MKNKPITLRAGSSTTVSGVNVRFDTRYQTNTCSVTNLRWIRIYVTRDIRAGEELYLDYGDDFWENIGATSPSQSPVHLPIMCVTTNRICPTTTTTNTTLSPIRRAPKTKLQRTPHLSGILPGTTPSTTFSLGTNNNSPAHTHTRLS